MIEVSLNLPKELVDELKPIAEKRGITLEELVADLLVTGLRMIAPR